MDVFNPGVAPGHLMVHFVLVDDSHAMDASVLHACEGAVLALVREVAKQLDISITIEAKALGEGGLESYLSFIGKHAGALALIGTAVTTLCSGAVWWQYQSKLLSQQIEANALSMERDKKLAAQQIEQNELNLRKTRIELKKLEKEAEEDSPKLPATESTLKLPLDDDLTADLIVPALLHNRRVIKLRSQFYEALLPYDKVVAVGFADTHSPRADEEVRVPRARFQDYVIRSAELEPTVIERAEIEIIAPVLTRDGGKWRGRFEKHNISFSIKDEGFLAQVAAKRVKFQNGTSLSCRLSVYLRENEAGVPQPHDYVVDEVHKLRSRGRRRVNPTSTAEGPHAGSKTDGGNEAGQGDLLAPNT